MNANALVVPALLLALAGSAHAQNALGDGRALDNNLQVGSGRTNAPRRDIQSDLNFRNAIVTGNVANGREFRGDIGYAAADDFRGTLGSNDLFRFRADTTFNSGSAYTGGYSGLATNNLRGLGGLQMQLDLPVLGQTQGLAGNLIINRSGSGVSGALIEQPGYNANSRVDPFGSITRSLRSTSAYLIDNAIQPEVVATIGDPTATDPNSTATPFSQSYQMLLTASELHGVRALSESSPAIGRARPMQQNPGVNPSALPPTGLPGEKVEEAEPLKTTGDKVSIEAAGSKVEARSGTYESAIEELRVRANKFQLASSAVTPPPIEEPKPTDENAAVADADARTPDDTDSLTRAMDQLRESLNQNPDGTKEVEAPVDASKLFLPDRPKDTTEPEPAIDPENPPTRLELVQRTQKMLAENPVTINTLAPAQSSNEIFDDHMMLGDRAMSEGRWFDAEERFTAAIAIKQGDPMAAAGRVNAQLAAGMYLSSALNLRNLLRAYPEVLGVRFGEHLLPRGERLEKVRTQLRGRSQLNSDVARDAGFLLAYLGHQTGDAKDVADGFAIIDRVDAAQKVEPDALTTTCKAVWGK